MPKYKDKIVLLGHFLVCLFSICCLARELLATTELYPSKGMNKVTEIAGHA